MALGTVQSLVDFVEQNIETETEEEHPQTIESMRRPRNTSAVYG